MIKELIYEYYKKKELEYEFDITKEINFAPSYFNDCKRKIFYNKTGETPSNPLTEATLVKMAMGNSIHDTVQRIFDKRGMLCECEDLKVKEYKGLKIKYRLDGIVQYEEGQRCILEIKSIYAAGFKAIETSPKPEHIMQLVLYMELEDIDMGCLLYIGRDNGYMVEYIIQKGDDHYKETMKVIDTKVEELKKLKDQIEKKEMPVRDYSICLKNDNGKISDTFQKDNVKYKTDYHCSYCMWKEKCWKEAYELIKDNRFFIDGVFVS